MAGLKFEHIYKIYDNKCVPASSVDTKTAFPNSYPPETANAV